jgi:hypothetical protein
MSFLKQLLNPFIEFDEAQKKEAAQKAGQAPPAPASVPAKPASAPPAPPQDQPTEHPLITGAPAAAPQVAAAQVPTYTASGTLSVPLPEHVAYFEKLIDDANRTNPYFQGSDYKEFVDSKLDIDDITDEALKYRTAYNVLKSTGLTREKLIATGQEYLNLIGRDMNAFQGAHGLQYNKEVRSKEQIIQRKAEELQALTQRINALKGEINQITQEINLTKDKLNTTKQSFLLAGEAKQKEIETELAKITQYF